MNNSGFIYHRIVLEHRERERGSELCEGARYIILNNYKSSELFRNATLVST